MWRLPRSGNPRRSPVRLSCSMADYRPLSYYPLSLWSWQDTLKAVFLDRVNIVSEYDMVVRSPTAHFRLPSRRLAQDLRAAVASSRLHAVQRVPARQIRLPVLRFRGTQLTFDHVVPRSKGGQTSWENVVAACSCCNLTKGDKMPAVAKMFRCRSPTRRRSTTCTATQVVPAELSARELDGLPLLGQRTGALRAA